MEGNVDTEKVVTVPENSPNTESRFRTKENATPNEGAELPPSAPTIEKQNSKHVTKNQKASN